MPSDHFGRSTDMQAGRAALLKIAEMIETRQSFIFETTLSSLQSILLMQEAKASGFTVGLYYVALDSVETNVERVRQRVLKGGHDIPEESIRRRHKGSLIKLTAALSIADEVLLIDNSGPEPHEVFAISSGVVQSFDIDDGQELHVSDGCQGLRGLRSRPRAGRLSIYGRGQHGAGGTLSIQRTAQGLSLKPRSNGSTSACYISIRQICKRHSNPRTRHRPSPCKPALLYTSQPHCTYACFVALSVGHCDLRNCIRGFPKVSHRNQLSMLYFYSPQHN